MAAVARSHPAAPIPQLPLDPCTVRKGYHALAVALFLPCLLLEPGLLGLALAVAFAVLVAVEAVRLAGLPHVSAAVHGFMTAFTDGRDVGPVFVTHFALLLGMAVPVWLELRPAGAGAGAGGPSPDQSAGPAALAGILILGASRRLLLSVHPPGGLAWVCRTVVLLLGGGGRGRVLDGAHSLEPGEREAQPACPAASPHPTPRGWPAGFGDAAASIVGRVWGRRRVAVDSKKTVEGLLAGAAATLLGWALAFALDARWHGSSSPRPGVALVLATLASCALESATDQLDNAVLPLHYYALLLLAGVV